MHVINQTVFTMILQLGIIFIFLGLGEFIVWITGISVPSSIIGMLLLFLSLCSKVVKLSQIEKAADLMVNNLGFFFIPAGIGVMKYFNLISTQWIPIVMAIVISSFLIILSTGGVYEFLGNKIPGLLHKKKLT